MKLFRSFVHVLLLCVSAGHVGAPLPCNLIKLLDVAEKNYFAAKGEGEVCEHGLRRKPLKIYFTIRKPKRRNLLVFAEM